MDEAKRKPIMIGIIVVCLGVAAYITFRSGGGVKPIEEVPEDATITMKCVNIKCNAVFEMSLREYRDFQKEHIEKETTPGVTCQSCGKPSAFEAMICSKCGHVFMSGESGRGDFPDRCPKCKYSAREEAQK